MLFTVLVCALGALYRLSLSAAAEQDIVLLRRCGEADTAVIAIHTAADAQEIAALSPEALAAREAEAASLAAARRVAALSEENPDCIGWLTLSAAGIDYPVMHTPDRRDYYIDRNFAREKSRSGLPFLDERCTPDGLHRIVYGHNMKDGSMFGSLKNLLNTGIDDCFLFFDDTGGRTRFAVFALFLTEVDEKAPFRFYAYADLSDPLDYAAYVSGVAALGKCVPDALPDAGTRLITLVTCSDHAREGRLVAVAAETGA